MRYLVTGGAGFIGSNTVDELVRRGQDVVVLDDLSTGKVGNLASVRRKSNLLRKASRSGCGARSVPRRGPRDSSGGADLRAAFGERPDRTNLINVDWDAECFGGGARRKSEACGLCQFLRGLRENGGPADSRERPPGADFPLRRFEICGRSVWPGVSSNCTGSNLFRCGISTCSGRGRTPGLPIRACCHCSTRP